MTDEQLHALVRDAVARHLGREGAGSPMTGAPSAGHTFAAPPTLSAAMLRVHPSHYRYPVTSGGDEAGPCLIEPTVACNHCGYCQSHGH